MRYIAPLKAYGLHINPRVLLRREHSALSVSSVLAMVAGDRRDSSIMQNAEFRKTRIRRIGSTTMNYHDGIPSQFPVGSIVLYCGQPYRIANRRITTSLDQHGKDTGELICILDIEELTN